ncbi:MAG TPA: hypothetical protein VHD87_15470 [Acidimicrobiales bacterium]|nr:hypothetical protein [Acidimicrobiales bacterium]
MKRQRPSLWSRFTDPDVIGPVGGFFAVLGLIVIGVTWLTNENWTWRTGVSLAVGVGFLCIAWGAFVTVERYMHGHVPRRDRRRRS